MNVRLLVLGLLDRGPLHGYEMRKLAVQNRVEAWTGILPGSIYHALKQMEKERLVALHKKEGSRTRPRAVYAITSAGRRAFQDLVRKALAAPIRSLPTDLYGGLLFLKAVPKGEIDAAIRRQVATLQMELSSWEEARPLKGELSAAETALYDNGIEHLRADLRLLEQLRAARSGPAK